MTDNWDLQHPTDPTEQPSAPTGEPTAPAEPVAPAEPTPVEEPAAPQPTPSWGSDGSYRYVPPRPSQPAPPPPFSNAQYPAPRQPWYSGSNDNSNNGGYPPADGFMPPPPPPMPRPEHEYRPEYRPENEYRPEPQPEPPRKKKAGGWIAVIAVLCAFAVIASVVLISGGVAQMVGGTTQPDTSVNGGDGGNDGDDAPTVNEDAPTLEVDTWDTADGGLSTEEIVKRNYNSTVVLTAYAKNGNVYFGESNLTEVAGASGIVMTADGYIITNRHCVINEETGKHYDRIDVTTYDGTVYEDATVVGADEATDLAVIKVTATNLTPAKFGDSDELEVGARVVALGNAAGLSWTATQGIVSAKAREVYEDTGYAIKCLQVDVAINSGNSGGPLLNKQGLVVGINSAKIAASGYEGLGFSIPINEAKVIIDSLLKYGYVKGRVALGITGRTIASGMYKGFMIETIGDSSCLRGTAAREGDLIVGVDDVTVTDYGTLRAELAKHQVGDRVTLKLLRSDSRTGNVTTHYVTVTLKEQTAG